MHRTRFLGTLSLLTALALGCSGSDVAQDEDSHDADGQPQVAMTTTPVSGGGASNGVSPDEVITPFEDNLDFFSPPKIAAPVLPPEPEEDTDFEQLGPQPLPPTRLVGFVNAGAPKAMLSIDGAVNIVSAGDSIRSMEVVAVAAPAVTLKHGGQEITLDLFTRPALAQRGAGRRGAVTHRRSGRPPAGNQPPPPQSTAPSIPALPGLSSPGANPPATTAPPTSSATDAATGSADILDPAGGFPGLPPAP